MSETVKTVDNEALRNKELNKESSDSLSTLLRQLRFRASVFFRSEYCGSWAVDTSGSRQVPFHMVCQGEGWLHSGDEAPQHMMAGQLVMFPQDRPHILANSPVVPSKESVNCAEPGGAQGDATRLVCGYFEFDQRAAGPLLASLPDTMIVDLAQTRSGALRELVNLWINESREGRWGGDLAVDLLAELVFLEMLRAEVNAGRIGGLIGALSDDRLGPVLHRIHAEPGLAHTTQSLSSSIGMSESAFAKRFREKVGLTIGAYLRLWRMQLAARALRESERSIADIAESVGYESEVAFRKAFSAYFEVAPGRYRRNAED